MVGEPPYTGEDFYCDIAIPRAIALDVVHECDRVLAFHHTRPAWSIHVVVAPKRHIGSLTTIAREDEQDVRALFSVVRQVAQDIEDAEGAARVITNLGRYQDSKHLHVHVVSGTPAR